LLRTPERTPIVNLPGAKMNTLEDWRRMAFLPQKIQGDL
jgi:hypothetical protein